jgi:hypothetical protein
LPLSSVSAKPNAPAATIAQLKARYPADSVVSPLKIKFVIYTAVLAPGTGQVLGIEPVDVF